MRHSSTPPDHYECGHRAGGYNKYKHAKHIDVGGRLTRALMDSEIEAWQQRIGAIMSGAKPRPIKLKE